MARKQSRAADRAAPIQPLYLKVSQVAVLLSLSCAEVYRLIDTLDLPAIRLGRAIRVPVMALERWLQDRVIA